MWECRDCGSKWWPRKANPERCPRCQRKDIFQSETFDKGKKEKDENKSK